MSEAAVLVVSVLPRGMPFGEPGLVSLEPESLEVLGYREFPQADFLADPESGERTLVRHVRGLQARGGKLFVTLFNAVGEYALADAGALRLELERRFTAPAAADLHGISVRGRTLAAASTGGNCIVAWDTETGLCHSAGIDCTPPSAVDFRFPERQRTQARGRWRDALAGRDHINDVHLTDDGAVVCSLTRVMILSRSGAASVVLDDPAAHFHDAQTIGEDRILATDGARGDLVLMNRVSGSHVRVRVTDPSEWFLRGAQVSDDYVYLLRSRVVRNRQLSLVRSAAQKRGATFGLSVVDLDSGRVVAESLVDLPLAPAGSVVYQMVACTSDRPRIESGEGAGDCDSLEREAHIAGLAVT